MQRVVEDAFRRLEDAFKGPPNVAPARDEPLLKGPVGDTRQQGPDPYAQFKTVCRFLLCPSPEREGGNLGGKAW